MSFYVDGSNLVIRFCSNNCILKKYENRRNEIKLEFAGASKICTKGIKVDNSFIVQKEAESWNGNHHDFGITINRKDVVENNTVLKKIRYLKNDNLLKIKDICQCCVELQYIDGYILNARKGSWILGEHAYEEDYLDICSPHQFISLTRKILDTIILLHQNKICHTDVMDHNIMVNKSDDVPILIDLIGAMPYTEELEKLDNRVFLEHVVIDGCNRLSIPIPEKIELLKNSNGDYCLNILSEYLSELDESYA
jgi:Serine/threonine protein kinase